MVKTYRRFLLALALPLTLTKSLVLTTLPFQDTYGFSLVTNIPPSRSTKTTETLLRKIAFIRETHYGAFWDFTADLKHGDLAYSNEELRSHTDTTYFTDVCVNLFFTSPPFFHLF